MRYKCCNPYKKENHTAVNKESIRPVTKQIIEWFSVDSKSLICNTCRLQISKELQFPISQQAQLLSNSDENVCEERIEMADNVLENTDDSDKELKNIIFDHERRR